MADDEEVEEEETVQVEAPEVEAETPVAEVAPLAPPKYEVRPLLGEKFQAQKVRDIILSAMQEQLMGRTYKPELAARWAKTIANGVRLLVQNLQMKRYKIMVQCTILETKGAGVKCAQRCIWDPETDDYADNAYRNNSLYCYTICYGVYMY